MKRGTIRHAKVYALADALKVRRAEAVGILTALWEMTAEYFPDGNIAAAGGTYLAEQCLWHGDGNELLRALIACGLVDDLTPSVRTARKSAQKARAPISSVFYIHDWHEHCETSVHKKIARQRGFFANGNPPKLNGLDKPDRDSATEFYRNYGGISAERQRNSSGIPTETPTEAVTEAEALARALAVTEAVPKPKPRPGRAEIPAGNGSSDSGSGKDSSNPSVSGSGSDSGEGVKQDKLGELGKAGNLGKQNQLSTQGGQCGHGKSQKLPEAGQIGQEIAKRLRIRPRGEPSADKQFMTDCNCLRMMAIRVRLGNCGPPVEAIDACYAKAEELGESATVENPISAFTAWFKNLLAQNGHEWKKKGMGNALAGVLNGLQPPGGVL